LPREVGTAVLSALVRQLGAATHLGGLLAVPYFRALYSLAASIQVRLVLFPACLDTPKYIAFWRDSCCCEIKIKR
jgi:hypothetical protein